MCILQIFNLSLIVVCFSSKIIQKWINFCLMPRYKKSDCRAKFLAIIFARLTKSGIIDHSGLWKKIWSLLSLFFTISEDQVKIDKTNACGFQNFSKFFSKPQKNVRVSGTSQNFQILSTTKMHWDVFNYLFSSRYVTIGFIQILKFRFSLVLSVVYTNASEKKITFFLQYFDSKHGKN